MRSIATLGKIDMAQNDVTSTGLNIRQEEFVFQLMSDPNFDATKAAMKAGYKNPATQSKNLMRNPAVQRVIRKMRKEAEQRTEVTVDRIRERLASLIFRDVRQLVYKDGPNKGRAIPLEDLPDEIVAALDGYEEQEKVVYGPDGEEVGRDIKRKYKISSITPNLDLMMKHLGMFEPQEVHVRHAFDFDSLVGDPVDVMGDDVEEIIEGAVVRRVTMKEESEEDSG